MTQIVVDASVVIKWIVQEPGATEARALRTRQCFAPDLMVAEYTNILWKKVTRGEMRPELAQVAAWALPMFDIEFCRMENMVGKALDLAVARAHPAYDCLYLALAEEKGCYFVTADIRLSRKLLAYNPQARIVPLDQANATLPPLRPN